MSRLVGLLAACALASSGTAWAASEIPQLARDAESRTGVPVFIPSTRVLGGIPDPSIRFVPLDLAVAHGGDAVDTERYLRLYGEEFGKYPRSFLRKVHLEWVAFVKELRVGREPRGATYQRWYAATTHEPHGGLVYDVRSGRSDVSYTRWKLHHEFFHFVDETVVARGDGNPAWESLNARDFKYTGAMAPYAATLGHPAPGLLTEYARKSVAEDRAELFAALMTDDEARSRLLEIVETDPIVRRKLRSLVGFLARIDPAMGEGYFEKRLGALWRAIGKP